jgi:uncharacterized protein YwqG
MAKHQYAQGQRWSFRSMLAEFEHELVIGQVLSLSMLAIPTPFQRPDQYWVFIRRTDPPTVPRDIEGVSLVMTADVLDRNVVRLIAEGEVLPEWWQQGAPFDSPGAAKHAGGMQVEEAIDDALRHLIKYYRVREEGRQLAASALDIDEVRRQLMPWIKQQQRPTWRPITRDDDGPVTASKFAGTPWLAADETWPACQACGGPMQLFLQLNLDADLPEPELRNRFGGGLLQLFYCTANERRPLPPADLTAAEMAAHFMSRACPAPGGQAFGPGHHIRIVDPRGPNQSNLRYPGDDGPLAPKLVAGWTRQTDLPEPGEHQDLGLHIDYDFAHNTATLTCPSLGLKFENLASETLAEDIADAHVGDKLAGWPSWVQNVEYPNCPRCGARMQFIFQLDSNDNLEFMFGDCGRGHITQCPTHRGVVAFAWACS